ncbi:MAG: hypothetical protein MIL41_01235 [Hyphomicrobiales bacterium]|jgi:hypothetical protein
MARFNTPQQRREGPFLELNREAKTSIVVTDRELLVARKELKRGAFSKWVGQVLGMSKREVSRCMSVAAVLVRRR